MQQAYNYVPFDEIAEGEIRRALIAFIPGYQLFALREMPIGRGLGHGRPRSRWLSSALTTRSR